jgi:hypothetical protein
MNSTDGARLAAVPQRWDRSAPVHADPDALSRVDRTDEDLRIVHLLAADGPGRGQILDVQRGDGCRDQSECADTV